jgi:hypothetical protein
MKTLGAFAALGALVLLPSFGATAPNDTPKPSPSTMSAVPCGYVSFIPTGAPRVVNGTMYERISVRVSFSDGHTETAEFPYSWIYPNGEQTDPWSTTNLRRNDFVTTMQLPPAGTDVKTLPPVLQYVIAHTSVNGYTDLRSCGPSREAFDTPSALDRARAVATGAPAPMWLTFVDDTPRNAPVTIVDATVYALYQSGFSTAHTVRECVTFWNRSPQTVAAIRFAFRYFDPEGNLKTIQPLARFGSFAPGVVVEGFRRGHMATSRTEPETLRNCRIFLLNGETRANHVAVTAVEFTDHSTWPPGSPSIEPEPLS